MISTRVFELEPDDLFPGMTLAGEDSFIFPAEGRVKKMKKVAPSFEVMADEMVRDPLSIKFADFISFSPGFCCFSETAWSVICSRLRVKGDITTLVYARDGAVSEFVLLELTRNFDCVDFDRSTVHYFDVPPYRVKWVDDLVVTNAPQVDEDIFRIEHLPTRVFCTEACVQLVKKHRFKGFLFRPVKVVE